MPQRFNQLKTYSQFAGKGVDNNDICTPRFWLQLQPVSMKACSRASDTMVLLLLLSFQQNYAHVSVIVNFDLVCK